MKLLIVLAMVLMANSLVEGQGFPSKPCPEGEHSVLYCPRKAEPSCDIPKIHELEHGACGVPDCFCNVPTVRDTRSGKCVQLENCP